MEWKKYTIQTTTQAEEFVSSMLIGLGITGIEVEDNLPITEEEARSMYIDILPELPDDKEHAAISFYLEEGDTHDELLEAVRAQLEELRGIVQIGPGTIVTSQTKEEDWINNWKAYFKPFTIEDILIKPTWEAVPADYNGDMVIEIDPGTAFGTGKHETTQLCIRQLRKHIRPDSEILDVGCGSGILSIISLLAGAGHLTGTDIDARAVEAANENMAVNQIAPERYQFYQGNLIDDKALKDAVGYEAYDIVVANILADVIIPLTPEVVPHLKHGGIYITSGILYTKEDEVRAAIEEASLTVTEITKQGDWVSITAVRP
jgi:ribosomal protein L11 methyltransferase